MKLKWIKSKILLLTLAIGILVLTGCSDSVAQGPEEIAERFLLEYFNVEDSAIADYYYNEMATKAIESYDTNTEVFEGFDKLVEEKYGPWMTERGLEEAMSNRFVPGIEMFSRETGNKISAKSVAFTDEREYSDGRIYYSYTIPIQIILADGEKDKMDVTGEIVMELVEEEWKVGVFRPNLQELSGLMVYSISNLILTNWDVEEVSKVEVSWEGASSGATNASGSNMELGSSFPFRMPDEEDLTYLVKVSDNKDQILIEEEFTSDFSAGRDFELYIMWDESQENVVLSDSLV